MSKPAFDPNQGFEPVEGDKPPFNPDAPVEEEAPAPEKGLLQRISDATDLAQFYPEEMRNKPKPITGTPFDNPLFAASSGGGSAVASAAARAARTLPAAATRVATSPLPGRLAEATNVVGKAKNAFGNMTQAFTEGLPEGARRVADFMTGAAGRKLAYSNPVTGAAQGVSDLSRGVQGVQKGVAWALDHAPQKLGKFAPILKSAAARGTEALATTEFLLNQQDPEYQQMKKNWQDGE